jgi:hypothetical protein
MPNATTSRSIGPWGTAARVVVGLAFVAGALVAGVEWLDAVLGLLALPLAVGAVVLVRGLSATPVRLTGPQGHCINGALGVAAFILVPVAAPLFYGGSMLVAAARGYGGCELFALSNWLWRRDDQIACPVFHLVDGAEHRVRLQNASR